jgi:G3E family GTPase
MHEYFDDPLSAPLVQRQLSAAHLICLSKTKGTEDISAMQTAISAIAPGRAIIALNAMDAELTEIVLGALMRGARPEPLGMHHDYAGFKTAIIEWPEAPSADAFFALLESIPDSVYRMKGWVTLQQRGELTRYEVQAAGSRWRVNASAVAPDLEQLVVIGRHDSEAFTGFFESLIALQQPG